MGALTIRSRLIGGFLVLGILVAAGSIVAIQRFRKVTVYYERALEEYSTCALVAAELKAALLEEVRAQKNYLLRADPSYLEQVAQHAKRVRSLRRRLGCSALQGSAEQLLRRLDAAIASLEATFQKSIGVREAEGLDAADRAMRGKAATAAAIMDELISAADRRALATRARASATFRRTLTLTRTLVACVGVLGVALGLLLSLSITRPLMRLRSQIYSLLYQGETPSAPAAEGRDEIADTTRAFRELVEKASLVRELESRSRRLTSLSAGVVHSQEAERARIARELHDSLGQTLTAAKLELGQAARRLGPEAGRGEVHLANAQTLIGNCLDELRRLVFDLRPPVLDNLGLVAALQTFARDLHGRTGLVVTVTAENIERRLPPQVETGLYRICQEALTNVWKHAQATHAWVHLEGKPGLLDTVIGDDGVGFDAAAWRQGPMEPAGVGLLGMERRAQELGGIFHVECAPGEGTIIRVSVPLDVEVS